MLSMNNLGLITFMKVVGMNKGKNTYIIDNQLSDSLIEFYLCDDTLFYSSNEDNSENAIKVIADVKIFDLCCDRNENTHIICVVDGGELIYLVFENAKWNRKTIQTFPSEVNSIDQVKIMVIDDVVHIFYDFKITAPKIKNYNYKSFIIHNYKSEYGWTQSYIGAFHQSINPKFFVDINANRNLYLFYLDSKTTTSSINSLIFQKKKMRWIESKDIELNNSNAELLQVLLDKNDRTHFIIKDINTNHVYHYFTDNSSDKNNKYTLIMSNKDAFDFKILEYNKKLCISWKSQNSISYINSDDLGKTWNNILEHSLPKLNELKYFNINNNMKAPKSLSTFGYLENNEMFILGITDMPKVENNVIETDTTINDLSNSQTSNTQIKEENETNTISDNNDLDFNYETTNSKTIDFDIQPKGKTEQSLWKKITNYLTLKE